MNVSLIMFKEDGDQRVFDLEPGKTTIGRQEDCDLRIPLGEVSRRHAVVMIEEKVVTLRDLGSSNGTYVNNQRITEQVLDAGDHVVIGPVVFTVQINGQPPNVRPVHTRLESRRSLTQPVSATPGGKSSNKEGEDNLALNEEVDPISELEALAASGTATVDLNASDLDIKPDDLTLDEDNDDK